MAEMTLRVITPDKILIDETVTSVRLPGIDGFMGVLPRHAHMIAALDFGPLDYKDSKGVAHAVFVGGGFAEVSDNTVRVVAPVGETAGTIDVARAEEAEKRARERLDSGISAGIADVDTLRAQLALRRAMMRIRTKRRSL
ncbi:ATP synthase F1 subunit epsilon [Engelhardtia mirabilis]|uniref:ATP synthase epsilon chain n=1 Tax=Engelhardtia mirabilis TaxID=2528011 RepID=A0A518BK52_9BACT|nr:ATP synthase epsilon chain [Planctomycetes bacterium Pla133]QDV01678.1 ATP synthase epsilon chain [Planctomycetes bacterium Pla86]